MKINFKIALFSALFLAFAIGACHSSKKTTYQKDYLNESDAARNQRMEWWREARFGLFIHWGLYAVPAGEWGEKNTYGEWIRTTAEIPLKTYDGFVGKFNPTQFSAHDWVQMAKNAGMKYIVITSKHHDGFAIYDSKVSDFDVMATPFKRDILKELADECKKEGIKLCFYHSIMDWHHPDYLPRRNWETDRSTKGAKFDRYVTYMKKQLKELLTNYGDAPHVLWFDGEWESTWNSEYGKDLYNYVRSLKPDIIINNRVGAHRDGMAGFTAPGQFAGDFGTPEQEIPATGLPGMDWESCMTMNNNWGYNKADKNFKSTKELLHNLTDIASKGGNFLLNVGPTAEGLFPTESIQRLKEIGEWMKKNGESIHGTLASPIGSFDWGRVTMKTKGENTILYLHVFNSPSHGQIILHGIANTPMGAAYLAAPMTKSPHFERVDDAIVLDVPTKLLDPINTVIMLQLKGKPDIHMVPVVKNKLTTFVESMYVSLADEGGNAEIHYTLDGTQPTIFSATYLTPIKIEETTTVTARSFRDDQPISGTMQQSFWKKEPKASTPVAAAAPGLQYFYFEGKWEKLPPFDSMKALKKGTVTNFDRSAKNKLGENYGFEYRGFIKLPTTGIYTFSTASDDGSVLLIDNEMLVDNDGLHGTKKVAGTLALQAGYHEFIVRYFNSVGGEDLKVTWASETMDEQPIPDNALFHVKAK
ncbi:MAG: alpha-L-fucosidase [Saprospiraceae bacterium]|nr:alpha-L-fucosidase [Saprospiraceae bacterium]MCF8252472.1 alpha-L-fucosidase [Saprospiraceae bacterium]MCF8282473.1 alpha-L-fucosidase [Bacteroidales bacterium]MCF8312661.1 alpha-L-fucosidase [Saprospiraceae bacterium]MCF8441073.1 alpha-L-fucosidase [Saprospiraceae bacterium]